MQSRFLISLAYVILSRVLIVLICVIRKTVELLALRLYLAIRMETNQALLV